MYSVAVLLSAYNGEKFISCQIDSILNQKINGGKLTLIVRDDGSLDSTSQILERYSKKDKRVQIIKGKNIGYIASFFELIYHVRGQGAKFDYYSLADQDDEWDNDKLQVAINTINSLGVNKPFLYQSTTRVVDENLKFEKIDTKQSREISFYNTMIQTFSPGHTYVFNRELLNRFHDNIDSKRLYGHDAYITNLAVIRGDIFFDNTPHNNYRQHGGNQLGTSNEGIIEWLSIRFKRVIKGDGRRYAKQIEYLGEIFQKDLDSKQIEEVNNFISYQKNFFLRLKYVLHTKFYRQGKMETIAFKLMYLFGGYNI